MVIAIDVDDTICNLQEVVINLFNERFGAHYKLSDFTEYDVMNVLPNQDGIVMRDMYGECGLYNKVRPIAGSQDALQKLINDGHQIYLVTAAIPKTYAEKIEFIRRHFPFIDESHICCIQHKWMFKCDIMIEDNLQTLLAKPYYHRVLFDRPWNRQAEMKDYTYGIMRAHSWTDVVSFIEDINNME